MNVQQICDAFAGRGDRMTEATFRKYVQLGLLPRSVRVGRAGSRRGSQGLYPASAVRQIDHVRRLMSQGFTSDEIQREFLFVRGDVEALGRQIDRVHDTRDRAIGERAPGDESLRETLRASRGLGVELATTLESIERRLTLRARMARAVV
jgi:hypothetical protein